jgi:hypothetical protein
MPLLFWILSFFAAAVPSIVQAQSAVWNPQGATNGNIFYGGGNVGIGTTTPVSKLNVTGAITLDPGCHPSFADGSLNMDVCGGIARLQAFGALNLTLQPYSGKVGIGTTNPQSILAVNGTITAKDVMVTNSGWPDFVFDPKYRLRPLSEVGVYIRAHGHLPDVPSAKEVAERGLSLGEMQATLLAKIEELTLHVIRLDEENRQ